MLHEILTELDIGAFTIKLNHRALLDGVMAIAGVPAAKFRPICSAIDKLDKAPWDEVHPLTTIIIISTITCLLCSILEVALPTADA